MNEVPLVLSPRTPSNHLSYILNYSAPLSYIVPHARMQCFSELVAPSAVTQSLSIDFLQAYAGNLIVIKTSLLQVFTVGSTILAEGNEARTKQQNKLVLVGEYQLAGVVSSLAKIRIVETQTGGDALLVAFKDAKVSLLEWDPLNHRISTISIHYYEGDKVPLAPHEPPLSDFESKLVVDPQSRCAALRFASRHLAIIPFLQSDDGLAAIEDDFLEDGNNGRGVEKVITNGDNVARKSTPYAASFVLTLTTLDPSLTHPVDIAFLFEYREPTFGIVAANRNASGVLLEERKDLLIYSVITLDLDQRASTTLLTVKGLPSDIWKIIPLSTPIGGSLLVGINAVVHVDQSGKTNAVGVNEFAKQTSNFSMADQSHLNLRLENACIETLNPDTGDLIIILDDGSCAVLAFRIDGRTVSGLNIHMIEPSDGGRLAPPAPSCASWLKNNNLFVGSEVGDARLLAWSAKAPQTARKRSHAQMLGEDMGFEIDEADLEDMDEDADDDLYGDESLSKSTMHRKSKAVAPEDYTLAQLDSLPSLAPINAIAFGDGQESSKRRRVDSLPLSMLASVGETGCSRLVALSQGIDLSSQAEFQASKIQSLNAVAMNRDDGTAARYVVQSSVFENERVESKLFSVDDTADDDSHPLGWVAVTGSDFEEEGKTMNIAFFQHAKRFVQVRDSEVRTYDADFGLSQILPIVDAATDDELSVTQSVFKEPYVLLLRQDASIQLLKADANGELEEIEIGELVKSSKWLSACLYTFGEDSTNPLCFLLSDTGSLAIFNLPDLTKASYTATQLAALPAVLTTEERQRRAAARDSLTELAFTDLGDEHHRAPYLLLRSSTDEITIYEPFHTAAPVAPEDFTTNLRFRKVPGLHLPRYTEELETLDHPSFMHACSLGGYATMLIPGESPSLVVKDAASLPRVVQIRGKSLKHFSSYRGAKSDSLLSVDANDLVRSVTLPPRSYGVAGCIINDIDTLPEGHEIHDIAYDPGHDLYVLITSQTIDYQTAEDELAAQEIKAGVSLYPKSDIYSIHLFDLPSSTIISSQRLPQYEIVTSLACAPLEMSETTHAQEDLVAVGTITNRGDNYATKGAVYLYRIIPVVPEPDAPQKRFALHLHSREEARAGITALTGLGGLLATAQGQKIMFRGLREDHQNLPVAFLDFLTYTTTLKTLAGSRMWLAADAWKGLWFGGFVEEPPRIHVFGRSSPPRLALVTAEFLPHQGQLFLLGVDERSALHVWQFDPEHPKSLAGSRLISKGVFELGHLVTGMKLLPSTIRPVDDTAAESELDGDDERDRPQHWQVLTTARTGQIGLVTALDEAQYRRLSALQAQLTNVLEHPAGLNPKAFRNARGEDGGGRGVVDGDVIKRISELGAGRRSEIVGRVAGSGGWWEVRGDLEIISGRGLSYF